MDDDTKRAIALWRIGVLGPLISARLEHGDRVELFRQAAGRLHEQPDGRLVRLSARTVETWFHQYRHGGFHALFPRTRGDQDRSRSIRPEVADLIVRLKREKPRRSIHRIIRILERAKLVGVGQLSKSSVHRLLQVHGVSAQPPRGAEAERRSFLHEHAGDLWVGDALHGPLVIAPDGRLRKAYLLSQIDGATRYVPYSYFALAEDAVAHEHGLQQALLKHGPPRTYYVDLGSAYVSGSLKIICAELGIHLRHTEAGDPEAKGVIERWHRTWRAEVSDELPATPLTLEELNARHWAWLSTEYHARPHDTTGRAPREHWLAEIGYLRRLAPGIDLGEVFLHRARRTVRKDGTVRFRGALLEVRSELVDRQVELRFDPHDPDPRPRVFVNGHFHCDTVPLDRLRNATRVRHRPAGRPAPGVEPTGFDPLAQMQDEHTRRARPIDARETDDPDDQED